MRLSFLTCKLRSGGQQLRGFAKFQSTLSHLSADGKPQMVDVGDKTPTKRIATARCYVRFPASAFESLFLVTDKIHGSGDFPGKKGPLFATSIIAGTMAAKSTSSLIPFCHQIVLEGVNVDISLEETHKRVRIDCTVKTTHKTGVEMEALVGATHAALTLYDMCKAVTHEASIESVHLVTKSGGKSDYVHEE